MKTFRSALCFLLVAATVLAYIPAFSVKGTAAVESPADIATIISRLETIKTGKYGVGKYFTENGKACTSHSSTANCHKATAAEAGAAGCIQCFGFARYVFYQLFGKPLPINYSNARKYEFSANSNPTYDFTGNVTVVGQSTSADAAAWKSILSQALPGDVIQRSKTPTSGQHTMIVESVDATGVQILDCNGTASLCKIDSRKMTWSDLAAKGSYFTLYRAVNYPSNSGEIMGTPPSDMDTIVRRLETIKAGKYGVGKYFTENGKACTSHSTSNGRSTNCHMATAAEAGTAGCWQCFGFARYVFYQLFGKPLAINYYLARRYELEQLDNITVVGQSTSANAAAWKSILSQALPGDVIQRSKTPTSGQHTMIVESVDATGVQILDCNGTASLCKIDSRKMTWSDLAAKGSCFTLYRAKNYPYSTYTVRYDANGGSGTTVSSVHTYGTAKALTANGYYRDGYTFQGWSTDKNATSAAYTDKQKVLNLTSVAGGTVTLYAVWVQNACTTHKYGPWTKVNDTTHKHTCSVCLNEETASHSWNSGQVTKAATCKENGIKTYTCTACKATKTEAISKTNAHSYGSWVKVNNTTHKRICSVCSKEESENHIWNSGSVTKQPTCKEEGVKTYTCTGCSGTKTEVIAKITTHSYDSWTKTSDTQHKHTCSVCGKDESANHIWNSGVVTKQPTCKDVGVRTYTCTDCNAAKTETIAKLTTHTYDHACDADCNVCGMLRTISHQYETVWSKDKTNHWHECSVCGEKIDVTVHTPGAEATETTAQKCTVCGYVIKAAFNHTHNYAAEWTTDEIGHWHACSGCEEQGSYTAHNFENACDSDCSVCGYTRAVSHNFGESYKSDGDSHWYECSECGKKKDVAAHEPGAKATATTAQTCTICGYEIVPALEADDETDPNTGGTSQTADAIAITDLSGEPANDDNALLWGIILIVACIGIVSAVVIVVKKKK